MVFEELTQHERSHDTDLLDIKEIFVIASLQDATTHEAGIVYQAMNAVGVLLKHLSGKVYKCFFVGNIANKIMHIPSFTTKLVAHHNRSFRIVVDKVHLIAF